MAVLPSCQENCKIISLTLKYKFFAYKISKRCITTDIQIKAVIKSYLKTVFINTLTHLCHHAVFLVHTQIVRSFGLILVIPLRWIDILVINAGSEICIENQRIAFAYRSIMKIHIFHSE